MLFSLFSRDDEYALMITEDVVTFKANENIMNFRKEQLRKRYHEINVDMTNAYWPNYQSDMSKSSSSDTKSNAESILSLDPTGNLTESKPESKLEPEKTKEKPEDKKFKRKKERIFGK